MRLRNVDLTQFTETLGSFDDVSMLANDYSRDYFQITLGPDQSYYIGLHKPFKQIYVELNEITTSNDISFKFYDGSSFVDLPNLIDRTKNFTRSDFVSWQFQDDSKIDETWKKTSVNGKKLYWVEISSSIEIDVSIGGINLIYSNDSDLKNEYPRIDDYLDPILPSFITFHVAARDEIVQRLRVGGSKTAQTGSNNFLSYLGNDIRQFNKWDFLNIEEIRNAAKFLTLAKIFFYASENNQDKAFTRYESYMSMFSSAFKSFYLSLDYDDDGNTDNFENLDLNDIRIEIV
jgi:hypothetical protein